MSDPHSVALLTILLKVSFGEPGGRLGPLRIQEEGREWRERWSLSSVKRPMEMRPALPAPERISPLIEPAVPLEGKER